MPRVLTDDDTPYDLEARQIRKCNGRAQRRLQMYICQLEKSFKGRVSLLDRQITQTKLEARTFKYEKDKSTFDLFKKYHDIAKDLKENGMEQNTSVVPILQPVRSKTFHKNTWQNPESEEYKSRLMDEIDKAVASDINRRVQSEPPVRPTFTYGRLDIPFRRENHHVRPSTCTAKPPHRATHKMIKYKRPALMSEGSRLSLKQKGEQSKVLPVFTNPATAHIHSLWESNKCLARGHVPIGGIHFDIPSVKGMAISKGYKPDPEDMSRLTSKPPVDGQTVTFRLPKLPAPHKSTPRRRASGTVYSVKLVS